MPYVKKAVVEKVVLSSDPDYFVMWRRRLTYGQMRDIAKLGQKVTDGKMEVDNLTATDALLLAHMESWNLTDEQDIPLPLTAESLTFLDENDVSQLTSLATDTLETREKERKN